MDYKTKGVFANIGASNHSKYEREKDDYYATDPQAIDLLHQNDLLVKEPYWECACGDGRLSERLKEYGYDVVSTDLFDRGYGETGIDFLSQTIEYDNIITNPPFSLISRFIIHAQRLAKHRVYMFAKVQNLAGLKRHQIIYSKFPPRYVCPFVRRIECFKSGANVKKPNTTAIDYAWYIWDKQDDSNQTEIKWLI